MNIDNQAYLAVISIEFLIPESRSLKTKRKITKSLIDRIRNKYNASVSEIGYLDKWQRSVIGISMISNNRQLIEKGYASIEQVFREVSEIDLVAIHIEWI